MCTKSMQWSVAFGIGMDLCITFLQIRRILRCYVPLCVLFSTDLQRQIGEREGQLQAMYSDPELQKVNMLLTHYSNTIGGVA